MLCHSHFQLANCCRSAVFLNLPSVRGDLLFKLGRLTEAQAEFRRAASVLRQNSSRLWNQQLIQRLVTLLRKRDSGRYEVLTRDKVPRQSPSVSTGIRVSGSASVNVAVRPARYLFAGSYRVTGQKATSDPSVRRSETQKLQFRSTKFQHLLGHGRSW